MPNNTPGYFAGFAGRSPYGPEFDDGTLQLGVEHFAVLEGDGFCPSPANLIASFSVSPVRECPVGHFATKATCTLAHRLESPRTIGKPAFT